MIVRDHDGQQFAHVYFEDELRRRSAAKLLTKDEARRIAANIAKLQEVMRQQTPPQFSGTTLPFGVKFVEMLLRYFQSLIGSLAVPKSSLRVILRNASSLLISSFAIPRNCLRIILGNAVSVFVHHPESSLRDCISLISRCPKSR